MTANLPPESASPSRRAVLAAALGGAAAMVARTVIQPSPTRAAGDDNSPILVGSTFLDVRTGTYLSDAATDVTVLSAVSSSASGRGAGIGVLGASGSGEGVRGTSDSGIAVHGIGGGGSTGVYASSLSGAGVFGNATTGIGVFGTSPSGRGVSGSSGSTSEAATSGLSTGNSTGVQGASGNVLPPAKTKTGVYGYAAQDSTSKGIYGYSPAGHAIHGESDSGWAGFFDGKVFTNRFLEFKEISNPGAPGANRAKIFARDNGSGKTQLCVRFSNGTIRVLATA